MDPESAAVQAAVPAGGRGGRVLGRISHPLWLVPIGIAIGLLCSCFDSLDIGHKQTIPLFMQGSTDWGGSITFAATMVLYVVCGCLGAIRLTLFLDRLPRSAGFWRRTWLGTWHLAVYWVLFVYGSQASFGYDREILPNDFRNMFLLAALLFAADTLWIVWLSRRSVSLGRRLVLAPLAIYLWLIVGSDGNTAKAGQVLTSGVDPVVAPRGVRHGLMLQWHALCDGLLGDVGPLPPFTR